MIQRSLLLLLLGIASILSEVDLVVDPESLDEDDECPRLKNNDSGACALNALQRLGRKGTALGDTTSDEHIIRDKMLTDLLASTDVREGASSFFDHRAAQTGALEQLQPEERSLYRYRFVDQAARFLREHQGHDFGKVISQLDLAMEEQKPIATVGYVEALRQAAAGEWEVHVPRWAKNFSLADFKLLGGHLDDPALANVSDMDLSLLSGTDPLPTAFDSRSRWPHCKEEIGHVRNQGSCSSCWAQATAGTMDSRLCIATSGRYRGSRAWASAGYITSCFARSGHNGCDGDNAGNALMRIAMESRGGALGVPTGSEEADTCVPYFTAKTSFFDLLHGKTVRAPACPASCTTQTPYPRSLNADKFQRSHGTVSLSLDINDFKRTVYTLGPQPMSFDVYKDFLFLLRGWYKHVGGKVFHSKPIYKHATLAIGWAQRDGTDYILSVNSWGQHWGEDGTFKMRYNCCNIKFFIVNTPESGAQPALPLPSPGVGASPGSAGCQRQSGGTCWLLGCDSSRGPTSCSGRKCVCQHDFCAIGGKCVPALGPATH